MSSILNQFKSRKGQLALLIDPEKTNGLEELVQLVKKAEFSQIDYFFVGGSTVDRKDIEHVVHQLKLISEIPVVIFPGSSQQLSNEADALLFLNLISGRNPDYLIGHQVGCALEVFEMNVEVLSTSYLLIDGGKLSSVAYVSQTSPIPRTNSKIALQTAIAGKLMGHQICYLDAGSGALEAVPAEMVKKISDKLDTVVIVGGGIRSAEQLEQFKKSGANIMVIGNKIEEDLEFFLELYDFQQDKQKFNS